MRRFRVVVNGLVYEVGVEEMEEADVTSPAIPASPPGAHKPEPSRSVPEPTPSKPHGSSHPPRQPAASGGGAGEVVEAPLPGTVLEVKVSPKDAVTVGQVLLVLEAMKMENEIVAPRSGVIEEVLVRKGGAVSTGDPLVRIV